MTVTPGHRSARRCVLLLASALMLACGHAANGPAPALEPAAVVRAQLAALARNDDPTPGSGIEQSWRFASPANRQATGPLERFRTLFDTRAYGPMLDHETARVSESREDGDRAIVGVVLRAADGAEHGYLFQLSRQRGAECEGCWMTDSVVPIPVPGSAPGPTI